MLECLWQADSVLIPAIAPALNLRMTGNASLQLRNVILNLRQAPKTPKSRLATEPKAEGARRKSCNGMEAQASRLRVP